MHQLPSSVFHQNPLHPSSVEHEQKLLPDPLTLPLSVFLFFEMTQKSEAEEIRFSQFFLFFLYFFFSFLNVYFTYWSFVLLPWRHSHPQTFSAHCIPCTRM
jgi:Mn2+/Fe2+ NRAMP family transporter